MLGALLQEQSGTDHSSSRKNNSCRRRTDIRTYAHSNYRCANCLRKYNSRTVTNKQTYPCNQIITGVSRKYGNTYRISDRIPQVRPQVPISAEWVGAVQQYSHLPSLPTKHQPAVSPTLPSMPLRAMTTAAIQVEYRNVPFPMKSLLSRKSEFFGNKLPSPRRRGSHT